MTHLNLISTVNFLESIQFYQLSDPPPPKKTLFQYFVQFFTEVWLVPLKKKQSRLWHQSLLNWKPNWIFEVSNTRNFLFHNFVGSIGKGHFFLLPLRGRIRILLISEMEEVIFLFLRNIAYKLTLRKRKRSHSWPKLGSD